MAAEEEGLVIMSLTDDVWTDDLNKAKESNKLIVIYFTTVYFQPKREVPSYMDLAMKFKSSAIFFELNAQNLEKAAQEFGVEKDPMFVLIKDGHVVEKLMLASMEVLEATIVKHTSVGNA